MKTKTTGYSVVVEPGTERLTYWKEFWHYRELLYFLSWRDILIRYKQTAIGIAWSMLRPFLTMVVFTVIFGKLGKFPSEGIPYPLLVFTAILPWQFFSNSLIESSNSLVINANMISKVYFPRLVVPCSSVLVNLLDFIISVFILLLMMIWYKFVPGIGIICIAFFLFLSMLTSLGLGIWFAALNVKYRDFRYIIPFLIQFGLYISPVGFSSTVVPDNWRLLYSLNPMVGVIEGFRWAILGTGAQIYWPGLLISSFLALLIFLSGVKYFRRTENLFVDVI